MTKLIFRHDNNYFLAIKMLTKERFQELNELLTDEHDDFLDGLCDETLSEVFTILLP